MTDLTIITASVNYSDYLQVTLPEACKFGRVVVVTSPGDARTIAVAKEADVECVQTRAWSKNKSPFSKGAGLNVAIEYAKPEGWLLLLDADILLMPPPPGGVPMNQLDTACLYGVQRRQVPTQTLWQECVEQQSWYDLPIDPLPRVLQRGSAKKVWGGRDTANPIGLEGYFQLWYHPEFPGGLSECRTAAKYDVELGMQWADDKRNLLPWLDYAVIHMGVARQNWKGRRTPRWNIDPLPAGAMMQAAERYYD